MKRSRGTVGLSYISLISSRSVSLAYSQCSIVIQGFRTYLEEYAKYDTKHQMMHESDADIKLVDDYAHRYDVGNEKLYKCTPIWDGQMRLAR